MPGNQNAVGSGGKKGVGPRGLSRSNPRDKATFESYTLNSLLQKHTAKSLKAGKDSAVLGALLEIYKVAVAYLGNKGVTDDQKYRFLKRLREYDEMAKTQLGKVYGRVWGHKSKGLQESLRGIFGAYQKGLEQLKAQQPLAVNGEGTNRGGLEEAVGANTEKTLPPSSKPPEPNGPQTLEARASLPEIDSHSNPLDDYPDHNAYMTFLREQGSTGPIGPNYHKGVGFNGKTIWYEATNLKDGLQLKATIFDDSGKAFEHLKLKETIFGMIGEDVENPPEGAIKGYRIEKTTHQKPLEYTLILSNRGIDIVLVVGKQSCTASEMAEFAKSANAFLKIVYGAEGYLHGQLENLRARSKLRP